MSMKRTKQVSYGRDRDRGEDSPFGNKPTEAPPDWKTDVEPKPDDAFVPYALDKKFAKGALISHPKFGKGIVSDVNAGKIDVIFQDGVKKLGHAG
jgi:hypothetical protein